MRKTLKDLIVGMESKNISSSFEREYIFHAKLHDRGILDVAIDSEIQEQWTVKVNKTPSTPIEGSVRVRKITKNGKTEYVLTTKTPAAVDDVGVGDLKITMSVIETNVPVDKTMFEQFKTIATVGMSKIRHVLPIPGSSLVYEVDSFKLNNGKFSEWVKIDLEVNSGMDKLPELPKEFKEVVYNQRGERTPEEAKLVQYLYDNIFWLKNPFLD